MHLPSTATAAAGGQVRCGVGAVRYYYCRWCVLRAARAKIEGERLETWAEKGPQQFGFLRGNPERIPASSATHLPLLLVPLLL